MYKITVTSTEGDTFEDSVELKYYATDYEIELDLDFDVIKSTTSSDWNVSSGTATSLVYDNGTIGFFDRTTTTSGGHTTTFITKNAIVTIKKNQKLFLDYSTWTWVNGANPIYISKDGKTWTVLYSTPNAYPGPVNETKEISLDQFESGNYYIKISVSSSTQNNRGLLFRTFKFANNL